MGSQATQSSTWVPPRGVLPEHKVANALPQGHHGKLSEQHPNHGDNASGPSQGLPTTLGTRACRQSPGDVRNQWHHQSSGFVTGNPPTPPERHPAPWRCHQKCPSSLHCTLDFYCPASHTRFLSPPSCPRGLPFVRRWGLEGRGLELEPGCAPAKAGLPVKGQRTQRTVQNC